MATKQQVKTWLRQHAAGERELRKVTNRFFRQQNLRIVEMLGEYPTPAALTLGFNADNERDAMLDAIGDTILSLMATGAARIVRESDSLRRQKAFNFGPFRLPQRIITSIQSAFSDLKKASFWTDIQTGIASSITDALEAMIGKGLSLAKIAKQLRALMGTMSKTRAEVIATTEVGAALNSGHEASYQSLAADGLLQKKEWLAILDDRVRETHAEANGQIVAVADNFIIGGFQTPYPGWDGLPARERCRCRCTTVAVFDQ